MHHCGALYRLIFSGKQMSDDKTAKEYNVEGGSVLHLVRGRRGTAFGEGCHIHGSRTIGQLGEIGHNLT